MHFKTLQLPHGLKLLLRYVGACERTVQCVVFPGCGLWCYSMDWSPEWLGEIVLGHLILVHGKDADQLLSQSRATWAAYKQSPCETSDKGMKSHRVLWENLQVPPSRCLLICYLVEV